MELKKTQEYLKINTLSSVYYQIAIFIGIIFAHEKAIQLIDDKYYRAKFSARAI